MWRAAAPAPSIVAASGQRLHNTGSVGGYLRQRSGRQNTVHPPCIGRTCFASNRRNWHPEHHARIGHGANQRNWRPNGCRSPAARHSSAILVRGRRVVGSWRRCGSDTGFGCRFRFCERGRLVVDRRLLGSNFGSAILDAGRHIIWLVPGTARFPARADRGDQDRLRPYGRCFGRLLAGPEQKITGRLSPHSLLKSPSHIVPMRPHVFCTCQIVTVPSLRLTGSAEPKTPMRRAQLVEHAIPVVGWKKMYNSDTDVIGF